MLTVLKFVEVEEGRAQPTSRDGRVEGKCFACSFLVCVWCSARFKFEIDRLFATGRTRTSRKLMSQQSAMCTQAQSVEPAGTHGEYGVIMDWDLIVFLELCRGRGRQN